MSEYQSSKSIGIRVYVLDPRMTLNKSRTLKLDADVVYPYDYGVATISRLHKIIGLFCRM